MKRKCFDTCQPPVLFSFYLVGKWVDDRFVFLTYSGESKWNLLAVEWNKGNNKSRWRKMWFIWKLIIQVLMWRYIVWCKSIIEAPYWRIFSPRLPARDSLRGSWQQSRKRFAISIQVQARQRLLHLFFTVKGIPEPSARSTPSRRPRRPPPPPSHLPLLKWFSFSCLPTTIQTRINLESNFMWRNQSNHIKQSIIFTPWRPITQCFFI